MNRTGDGINRSSPREIIMLLNSLRSAQTKRLEQGLAQFQAGNSILFERVAFKEALPEVSTYRTERNLYAEYPDLKVYVELLREQKCEHTLKTLGKLWNTDLVSTSHVASKLVAAGFFHEKTSTYWIPFVFRPYLCLVQGKA